jgi:hypothetical protein
MAEYLLHIGAHKTATTYIQLTLNALRDRLASNGVLYPSVWRAAEDNPGHAGLVQSIKAGNFDQLRSQFDCINAQQFRVVLISAEDLEAVNDSQIDALRDLLDGSPVRVIYYVRRWSEALRSNWQESVKHGSLLTLPEFITGQMLNAGCSRILNFGATLDAYARVFGTESITVASYSQLVDSGIDVAQHFLATFLDMPDLELPIQGRPNASPNIFDTEMIRILNSIHRARSGTSSEQLRNWYLDHGRLLVVPPMLSAMRANIGVVEIDETMPPMQELQRKQRTQYAGSIVPPAPELDLFEPRAAKLQYVRPDHLTGYMIPEMIQHIYQSFVRETAQP